MNLDSISDYVQNVKLLYSLSERYHDIENVNATDLTKNPEELSNISSLRKVITPVEYFIQNEIINIRK
jgi:hypothetical protein